MFKIFQIVVLKRQDWPKKAQMHRKSRIFSKGKIVFRKFKLAQNLPSAERTNVLQGQNRHQNGRQKANFDPEGRISSRANSLILGTKGDFLEGQFVILADLLI